MPLGFEISGLDRSRTWVSRNGVFAFGFFKGCQKTEDFDGFVVGIRYNLGDEAANVPVWTVGGGLRVPVYSTVRLSMDGRLVLFANSSNLIVWSSNTSGLGVQKATLLNDGNLVLTDNSGKVLWGSFASPTSTLLPGQSLHFSQSLRAPSTKSISSYYNFLIQPSGELAIVWESNVTYWKTHTSSSGVSREARFDANGVLRLIDVNNKTVWSASSKDSEDPSVVLRHLKIDTDGNLRIYLWNSVLREWRVGWQAVENQCDVFGSCGLYSLCEFNSTGPLCDCLSDDSNNLGTGLPVPEIGSSRCGKMADLASCKMNTSMMVFKQTVLYGLYPPQDVVVMLSEEACKEYCSNDATCIAVTSRNDGSGVCTVKRTSFITGYRKPSIQANSFLKVCLVPQAVSARANLHGNSNQVTMSSKGSINHGGNGKEFAGAVAITVLVTVLSFLSVQIFMCWFIYRRLKQQAQTRIPFGKDEQMNSHYSAIVRLSFEEIKDLTSNFAHQLGPSIFKGLLPNKTPVIAKVLNDVVVTEKEFRGVVSMLGGMHHRNLVHLKGFCFEGKHKYLLYEYVPNGSLDKWLFDTAREHEVGNWQQRLNIAIGVARALAYLHLECQTCVAHGNLKLENVLLDENMIPKVADFGLRRLLRKDTASSSETPSERDIHMFGEMLLQIVTCQRNILDTTLQQLVNGNNDELQIELRSESCKEFEEVERAVSIALWCMQSQPFLRPSITEVVKVLEGAFSIDRPPLDFRFRQEERVDID